jgi:hypothetical protein
MDKPITKIAAEATHNGGGEDISSPTKYVNKMKAKTSTMMHEYWPKMQQHVEDGAKAAQATAALNTTPIATDEEECEEGYVKGPDGQCVADDKNLNKPTTVIPDNTLTAADQSGDGS